MSVPPTDAEYLPPPKPEPRLFRWISHIEIALAGVLFLSLFVGVLWQVLGRYVPAANWPGAGEIARYSLVGLTFITVGYLIGKNGQITVSVIDNIVGPKGAAAVRFVAAALLAVISLVLVFEAWELFAGGFRRTTAVLRIPYGYLFVFPVIGFVSGTLMAITKMVRAREPEPDRLVLDEDEEN